MTSPTGRPDATSPRVGVVTVAYHSDDVLGPFLRSLAGASSNPIDTVVVDNAAEPGTRTLALGLGARYLELPSNPGYGAAVNAGVAALPAPVGTGCSSRTRTSNWARA